MHSQAGNTITSIQIYKKKTLLQSKWIQVGEPGRGTGTGSGTDTGTGTGTGSDRGAAQVCWRDKGGKSSTCPNSQRSEEQGSNTSLNFWAKQEKNCLF